MDKKGVSPLIATVLIIGFTIALAAIVMTWGGGFVKTTTEKTGETADLTIDCVSKLGFKILGATAVDDTIQIENTGTIEIVSLKFRFYDADGAMVGDIVDTWDDTWTADKGVEVYNIGDFTIVDGFPADADKVEAIAGISDGRGGEYVCSSDVKERLIVSA